MSCECAQCRQHFKTLGFMFGAPSDAEIQGAYHEAVKQWHPDLYENFASLRADAEEHFKQIQVAYRELKEHNGGAAETPEEFSVESITVQPKEETPALAFGNAPGCQTAPNFTEDVEEIIERHLGKNGKALAIVDLSGNPSRADYSQFLLLTLRGLMLRDSRKIISVVWYADLGEINLIDRNKSGKLSAWQKLAGGIGSGQTNSELQINRNNGTPFFTISRQADDSVKTIIYNFLIYQKSQAHP
jgi:hypothetical protein